MGSWSGPHILGSTRYAMQIKSARSSEVHPQRPRSWKVAVPEAGTQGRGGAMGMVVGGLPGSSHTVCLWTRLMRRRTAAAQETTLVIGGVLGARISACRS